MDTNKIITLAIVGIFSIAIIWFIFGVHEDTGGPETQAGNTTIEAPTADYYPI